MPQIEVIEFDGPQHIYLCTMQVPTVPRVGDKINYSIKDVGFVFNVIEVHFGEANGVDVYVRRVRPHGEYWERKGFKFD